MRFRAGRFIEMELSVIENNPIVGVTDSIVDNVQPPAEAEARQPELSPEPDANGEAARPVDAARSAAGRLGAKRVQELARLGREYERELGLKPGRQRRKQLIQLGRRYEVENGLRAPKPRRRKKGDAWTEFLIALTRVVKPAHRPAVERLVAALQQQAVVAQAA
jgi:hypothetical protein